MRVPIIQSPQPHVGRWPRHSGPRRLPRQLPIGRPRRKHGLLVQRVRLHQQHVRRIQYARLRRNRVQLRQLHAPNPHPIALHPPNDRRARNERQLLRLELSRRVQPRRKRSRRRRHRKTSTGRRPRRNTKTTRRKIRKTTELHALRGFLFFTGPLRRALYQESNGAMSSHRSRCCVMRSCLNADYGHLGFRC